MDLSIAAQARLAVAAAAAELSEQARTTVPVHEHDVDELVELATRLVSQAEDVQRLAVAAARETGHSWEDVGERLGTSKQAAHKRYDTVVAEIHESILFPSRRGAKGAPGWWACPDGLEDPRATIARLDAWVDQRRQRHDPDRGHGAVSAGIQAISDRHPGVTGIGLVTKLAKRIMDRDLPSGVTEEDARILLLRAKVVTYDEIARTSSGLQAEDAAPIAQAAYDELVELHRGRTRAALTLEPGGDHTVVLYHGDPVAAIARTHAKKDIAGWWLWGVTPDGAIDGWRGVLDQIHQDPDAPAELAETAGLENVADRIATDLAKGIGPFRPGGITDRGSAPGESI